MSSTAFARFEERQFEDLPPTAPRWPGSTPEQLDFMRRVYNGHVARSRTRGGQYIGDIPGSELATVDAKGGPQMRKAAAADCRFMLTAARSKLAQDQAAGSASAQNVRSLGI